MTPLAAFALLFLAVGTGFIFVHLVAGALIRPRKPGAEKGTIYECGEPTIGSAWIQFDLRYYVVALLFVVFDVEVAFFFPWATVFGQSNELARSGLDDAVRAERSLAFNPPGLPALPGEPSPAPPVAPETAKAFAWLSLIDIAVFFGVLMVGFAYLWRRGDIDWVRSTSHSPPVTSG